MDSSNFLSWLKGDGATYTALMFVIYNQVVQVGLPNFMCARMQVPTNLNLAVWGKLATTPEPHRVIEFLTCGFLVGCEGGVPFPSTQNHTSVHALHRYIAVYITTDVEHGAMLGPFDNPPFTPWCQTNPLLTHPKKDCNNRHVILDLS